MITVNRIVTRFLLNIILITLVTVSVCFGEAKAARLKAGAAKVDITNTVAYPLVNDSLYVKALVLENGPVRAAIITVDAVAIGGIGSIGDDYLQRVRRRIENEL